MPIMHRLIVILREFDGGTFKLGRGCVATKCSAGYGYANSVIALEDSIPGGGSMKTEEEVRKILESLKKEKTNMIEPTIGKLSYLLLKIDCLKEVLEEEL